MKQETARTLANVINRRWPIDRDRASDPEAALNVARRAAPAKHVALREPSESRISPRVYVGGSVSAELVSARPQLTER